MDDRNQTNTDATSVSIDWDAVNWRNVYRRSHRPVSIRGFSSYILSRHITLPAITLLIILFCTLVLPGAQTPRNWGFILLYLAALVWLVWCFWPAIENRWAGRFIFKVRVHQKLEATFSQGDEHPIEIIIREAFRITPKGDLIDSSYWKGNHHFNIPTWLYHIVDEEEELDLVCLSTHKILGKLDEFVKP